MHNVEVNATDEMGISRERDTPTNENDINRGGGRWHLLLRPETAVYYYRLLWYDTDQPIDN